MAGFNHAADTEASVALTGDGKVCRRVGALPAKAANSRGFFTLIVPGSPVRRALSALAWLLH
jgi:hypothetical protein